jgi:HTH-type transcriptional regulator / antitoxin HipB
LRAAGIFRRPGQPEPKSPACHAVLRIRRSSHGDHGSTFLCRTCDMKMYCPGLSQPTTRGVAITSGRFSHEAHGRSRRRDIREISPSRNKRFLPRLRDKAGLSLSADMDDYIIRTPQQLGAVLQGYRKSQQLTQAQVGGRVGLPQKEISKLELNPTNTSLARVFKLLAALDLELVVRARDRKAPPSEW